VLASIENFRDFGGFRTQDGRTLKLGRLYRSGAQHQAADEDLAALAQLGVQVVVDLRHPSERKREVCRRWPGFCAEVIDNGWEETFPSWAERLKGQMPSVELLRKWKRAWYAQMATEPGRFELFARCLDALATTDRPVLIHCSAGKDRTGVLVALIQHAVGIGRDEITTDFLRSNNDEVFVRKAPGVSAELQRISGSPPDAATVRASMAVEAGYLEAAFEGIVSRYGSIEGYFEQALGLGPSRRAALQSRLLG
jgi:protein tyrosine/serine phosphatase